MVSSENDKLRSLLHLARSKAREQRQDLLECLDRLFLSEDARHGDRESAVMADIIWRFVHELELSIRRELAERLPNTDGEPPDLTFRLADEELEMSRNVLFARNALDDEILAELAKHRAYEHLLADTWQDAFDVESGGKPFASTQDHFLSLMQEAGAENDPVLTSRAREFLVAQAKRLDKFHRPILSRAEVPPKTVHMLIMLVSAALLHQFVENHSDSDGDSDVAEQYNDIFEETAVTVSKKLTADAGIKSASEKLVDRLSETGELTRFFLMDVFELGYVNLFVDGLARLCSLSGLAARRIVFNQTGEGLLLASRALGFSKDEFENAYRWTRLPQHAERSTIIATELLKMYDLVSEKTARKALSYWDRDSDFLAAKEKIEN